MIGILHHGNNKNEKQALLCIVYQVLWIAAHGMICLFRPVYKPLVFYIKAFGERFTDSTSAALPVILSASGRIIATEHLSAKRLWTVLKSDAIYCGTNRKIRKYKGNRRTQVNGPHNHWRGQVGLLQFHTPTPVVRAGKPVVVGWGVGGWGLGGGGGIKSFCRFWECFDFPVSL